MTTISASILSADFSNLKDQIHQCELAGVDKIHVDVMDGQFVPNLTMGPFLVENIRKITRLPIDVHLMIVHPENFISAFVDAGADYISIHIEGNPHTHRIISSIKQLNRKAGIVLNPGTPVESISAIIPYIDFVLVMSVNPGFSGQSFIPETLPKIRLIKKMIMEKQSSAFIQIDGGITANLAAEVVLAGVDCIVAATSIFKHPEGIKAGVNEIRNNLK